MNAREKQCTPFTGLLPWRPCFPLCFGTGQIGERDQSAEAVRVFLMTASVVHRIEKSRKESGQDFSKSQVAMCLEGGPWGCAVGAEHVANPPIESW